jgi:hypothetical protein
MSNDTIEPIENTIPIVWIDREDRKKGRPIKPQYLDKETGKSTYKNHPVDPEYYKKYWLEKLKSPMQCARCMKVLSSEAAMRRHQKKPICMNHAKITEELIK